LCGTYSVTVAAAGFQIERRAGIEVTAGQPSAADVRLQVAAETQTVEVSKSAGVLQTGNADVTTTYNKDMIQNSPNPGGDITFDADMALMKDIAIGEHATFSFGAQAYNVFNHPNFNQPVNDISNPQFGSSIAAVGPPTSLLGSFVGAGSSPRFLEIKALVRF
jgi:hypothetical protein